MAKAIQIVEGSYTSVEEAVQRQQIRLKQLEIITMLQSWFDSSENLRRTDIERIKTASECLNLAIDGLNKLGR